MSNDVIYADENDREIGSGSIDNAVNNRIRVRIARVFLTNHKNELLIQKRSDNHPSLPGRWDQTSAGHVDVGESYRQAAERELAEEMGIRGVKLSELTKFYSEEKDEEKIKKRFSTIFTGTYDGEVSVDPHEVSGYKWISQAELAKQMEAFPDDYTEGFIRAFKIFRDKEAA